MVLLFFFQHYSCFNFYIKIWRKSLCTKIFGWCFLRQSRGSDRRHGHAWWYISMKHRIQHIHTKCNMSMWKKKWKKKTHKKISMLLKLPANIMPFWDRTEFEIAHFHLSCLIIERRTRVCVASPAPMMHRTNNSFHVKVMMSYFALIMVLIHQIFCSPLYNNISTQYLYKGLKHSIL